MTHTEDEGERGFFLLLLGTPRSWIGKSMLEEGRGPSVIRLKETAL